MQALHDVGLGEHRVRPSASPGLVVEAGGAVAAGEDHRDPRSDATELLQCLDAVHPGHGQVEEHGVDPVGLGPEHLDGLGAVARDDHLEAESPEQDLGGNAHVLVVVHEEHAPLSAELLDGPGGHTHRFGGADRKEDANPGALPRLALDVDRPSVTAHDAEDGRHAEAAARELRREERIEHLGNRRPVHAGAVVPDLQPHIRPGLRFAPGHGACEHRCIVSPRPRGDADGPVRIRDGLRRVEDEVHHDLADLRLVAEERRKPGRELTHQRHPLRDGGLEHARHLVDERAQLHRLAFEAHLARVGEHLTAQVRRAFRGQRDGVEVGRGRRADAGHALGKGDPVRDDRQDVVEVVRHASRQHAEALQLLRLPDALRQGALLRLDPPSLGDVADDRHARRPALKKQSPPVDLRDERAAVPAAGDTLEGLGGSAPDVFGDDGARLGSREVHQGRADHRCRVEAVHRGACFVREQDLAFCVHEDPFERRRGERAEPFLARLQRADRVLAFRDVPDEGDVEGPVGDDHTCRRDVEGKLGPVLAQSARLVPVGEAIAPRSPGDHLQDLRPVRGRYLPEQRRAA